MTERSIKTLLIYPPEKDDAYVTMPLGLGYIASVLRMNGFKDVKAIGYLLKYRFGN